MMVLVPAVMDMFRLKNGTCLLAAILVLAVMILPSIISVSETALLAVPPEYEEASLALGASKMETVFKVSIPAAKSGIAAGVVLGIGRAVGEAMAVMMVAGNVANMPGLFKSVTFLTTAVAKEMSYAGGLQRQALFSIALVLFCFIMVINAVLNIFLKRGRKMDDFEKRPVRRRVFDGVTRSLVLLGAGAYHCAFGGADRLYPCARPAACHLAAAQHFAQYDEGNHRHFAEHSEHAVSHPVYASYLAAAWRGRGGVSDRVCEKQTLCCGSGICH